MKPNEDFNSILDNFEFPNYTQEQFDEFITNIAEFHKNLMNGEIKPIDTTQAMLIMPMLSDIILNDCPTEEELREEWAWLKDKDKFNERIGKLKEEFSKLSETIESIEQIIESIEND